jgi:hypothetical protein
MDYSREAMDLRIFYYNYLMEFMKCPAPMREEAFLDCIKEDPLNSEYKRSLIRELKLNKNPLHDNEGSRTLIKVLSMLREHINKVMASYDAANAPTTGGITQ